MPLDHRARRRLAPPSAAVLLSLLVCSLLEGASAAALQPRPTAAAAPGSAPAAAAPLATTTVPYRALNVVPWPLPTGLPIGLPTGLPTGPPGTSPAELRRLLLRDDSNTICGYIGGNPDLPATCSAGSHCVLDSEHSVVGCCPNGVATCTAGVFTGCIDGGRGDATEVNPYVYTCGSGSVCYKNTFPGGYYQYGCGSASTMGQSVAAVASGKLSLAISSERVTFTGAFTSTSSTSKTSKSTKSTKTSKTSKTSTSSSSSSSSSLSSSSSSRSSSSSTLSSTSSHTPTGGASSSDPGNEANNGTSSGNRAGVIIGATISGVAGLIAIVAIILFCCWKRRRRGVPTRRAPSNFRGASGSFRALHNTPDDFESGFNPEMAMGSGATGTVTRISAGGPPPPRPPRLGDYDNPFHTGGKPQDDTWATPAVGTAAMAAVAAMPNRRGSAGGSSLLSRDASKRSSYRGVVTTSATNGPSSVTGSLLSRAASTKAVYTQIAQQSPYYDASGNPPPQHAYNNMSAASGHSDMDDIDHLESDQVPLNHEFDDFTRGYQDALSRIEEDDTTDLSLRQSLGHDRSRSDVGDSNTAAGTGNRTTINTEDGLLPQPNRASVVSQGIVDASVDTSADTLSHASRASHASHSLHASRGSASAFAFADSTLSGTQRDSSGVLPPSHQPLNLRGGGSSGLPSSTSDGSQVSQTTEGTTAASRLTAASSLTAGNATNHGGAASRAASRLNDQLSLNMTSPSLSLDGQLVAASDGAGGVSPPAAALAAGKTLSPPASPPASPPGTMRPLWQQNRQKSRNLMWL